MRRTRAIYAIVCLASLAACQGRPAAEPATLIVHNAHVYPVHDSQSTAESVAVRGDRIILVGTNQAALELRGTNTRVIDARGATLVPGLEDSHGHFKIGRAHV